MSDIADDPARPEDGARPETEAADAATSVTKPEDGTADAAMPAGGAADATMPAGGAETDILEELRPLFYPRSIAVVGVSQDMWKPGSIMLRSLMRFGFAGPLYPVSNRGGELLGLRVYQSVSELPEAADLAFLFVPGTALPSVVRECREKGVRGIVAFTSGFSETGTEKGRALEAELVAEFDGSFRMVGPNCLGLYSPAGGVTQHPGESYSRECGDVSFIAQSGGLSEDFSRAAPNYGFFPNKVVSYGNACDLNEADFLEYMGLDPTTRIIGMYIEGPRNGKKLVEGLRRVGAQKPVVVWKGGLTPQGAQAASSHTGSLAGSLEVWKAMLRQTGAIQVTSLEEELDTLAAFHFLPGHSDVRVGYVCAGGGNSVAAGDASYRAGLPLPHMSAETEAKIASFLPPVGTSAANPVDVLAPYPSSGDLKGMLEAMAGSGEVGAIIVDKIVMSTELRTMMNYAEQMERPDDPWLSELPVRIQETYGLPVIVVLRENLDPARDSAIEVERLRLRRYYQDSGVAVYPTSDRAFRSLGQVVAYYRRLADQAAQSAPAASPAVTDASRSRASVVIEEALARGQKNLSEHEAKQVLAAYGIPVTREELVTTSEELTAALPSFDFPLVLKIDSPDILHKTEAGLVKLGCRSAEDAQIAFERILSGAKEHFPAARINGVLVQEMVSASSECIVGMKVDPQFGPAIMFGLGGIFVEVFEDVALRVAPLAPADAADMIRETKGYKILAGARGQAKADVTAIEDVLLKMSALAVDLEAYLTEIDINPLMVGPEGRGAKAADALMLLKDRPA